MARNSRFSTTSGPSANRSDKRGKSFKKNEGAKGNRKTDFKSSEKKATFSKRVNRSEDPIKREKRVSPPGAFSKPASFVKGSARRESPSFSRVRGNNKPGDGEKPKEKPSAGPYRKTVRKSFVDSRLDKQRQRRSSPLESQETPKDELIRLNRFISNSGVCSRREADDLIAMGLITVNGTVITELGYKVRLTDDVRHDGKRLKAEKPVYILLNKPKGFITTTDDPQERNTVMHLIEGACRERVYPVGRLDRNTSGLLLLTNDGSLTEKLSHPSHNVKKIYKAELDRPLTKDDFQKIRDGVRLEEGRAVVDDIAIVSDDGKTVGLELHIGWNRIVRRIFEALGYTVVKLDRSVYATLDKKDLPRGHWRFLRQDEIIRLKHFQ